MTQVRPKRRKRETSALFLLTLVRCEGGDLTLRRTFCLLTERFKEKKPSQRKRGPGGEIKENIMLYTRN